MGSILPKLYFFFKDLYNFGSFLFGLGHFQLFGFARFSYSVEEKRSTICYGTRLRVPAIRESEKRSDKMTLVDDNFKNVPEYYDWMYLDGYTPEEIMYAFHRKMDREQAEREALEEGFDSIKVKSEVKLKK